MTDLSASLRSVVYHLSPIPHIRRLSTCEYCVDSQALNDNSVSCALKRAGKYLFSLVVVNDLALGKRLTKP